MHYKCQNPTFIDYFNKTGISTHVVNLIVKKVAHSVTAAILIVESMLLLN